MKKIELIRALAAIADDEEVRTSDLDIAGVEIRENGVIHAVLLTGAATPAALMQLIARKTEEIAALTADLVEKQVSIAEAEAEKAAAQRALDEKA